MITYKKATYDKAPSAKAPSANDNDRQFEIAFYIVTKTSIHPFSHIGSLALKWAGF